MYIQSLRNEFLCRHSKAREGFLTSSKTKVLLQRLMKLSFICMEKFSHFYLWQLLPSDVGRLSLQYFLILLASGGED